MAHLTVKIPDGMEESLKRVAKKRNISKSQVVKRILRANLPKVDPVLKRKRKTRKQKGIVESIFGPGEWF